MSELLLKIHKAISRYENTPLLSRIERILLRFMRYGQSRYGPKFYVERSDYTSLAAFKGSYGFELIDLIKQLPKDGTFFDIGANQGIYSLVAGQHLSAGKVFSFEPNPYVFSKLLENVKLNKLENISAFCCGLSDANVVSELSFSPYHTGRGNTSGTETQSAIIQTSVILLSATLFEDVFLNRNGAPRLCKIDVEGAEMTVLRGLGDQDILRSIDSYFIEICHSQLAQFGATALEIYDVMEKNGFVPRKGISDEALYDEVFEKPKAST